MESKSTCCGLNLVDGCRFAFKFCFYKTRIHTNVPILKKWRWLLFIVCLLIWSLTFSLLDYFAYYILPFTFNCAQSTNLQIVYDQLFQNVYELSLLFLPLQCSSLPAVYHEFPLWALEYLCITTSTMTNIVIVTIRVPVHYQQCTISFPCGHGIPWVHHEFTRDFHGC